MPALDRIVEVRSIAAVLWFLPPPARREFADKLHGLGVRVHPELAALEIEFEGPKEFGNHRQQRPVSKKAVESESMDALRSIDPVLVAKIEEARKRRDVLERMAAIKEPIGTDAAADAERARLCAELGIDAPTDVFGMYDQLKAMVDAYAADEKAKGDAERAAAAEAAE